MRFCRRDISAAAAFHVAFHLNILVATRKAADAIKAVRPKETYLFGVVTSVSMMMIPRRPTIAAKPARFA